MHKDSYASGFLYHPSTRQILLQQQKQTRDTTPLWSLLGGIGKSSDNAQITFQRVVHKLLHIKLKLNTIEPVYVYFYKDTDKNHSILYAEIAKTKNFSSKRGIKFSWFTFKQILKLQLDEQTRHDIIVGQRVIDAKERKRLGQQFHGDAVLHPSPTL